MVNVYTCIMEQTLLKSTACIEESTFHTWPRSEKDRSIDLYAMEAKEYN